MSALKRRGLRVAPFKTGPDFIDPGLHALVCNRPSHNLDSWMMPQEAIRQVFLHGIKGCDVAVIEGAMGLFDGASAVSDKGSCAHIAKILDVPVLLVVDSRSMGRSVAAMVKGYMDFDKDVKIQGIVANKVGSKKHKKIILEALGGLGPFFVATISRNEDATISSRHLGLLTAMELGKDTGFLKALGDMVESQMDLDALLGLKADLSHLNNEKEASSKASSYCEKDKVRIAVAMDRAFCFYYQRNLDILEGLGASLSFFSPTDGEPIPDGAGGIYLGGGYPELYARALWKNAHLRHQIKTLAHKGMPILAECGGFMFLGKGLKDKKGFHEWCGLFDVPFVMEKRFQALGYRKVQTCAKTLLGPSNIAFRGHEFRYSRPETKRPFECEHLKALDAYGNEVKVPCFVYKNVFASYIHIHFDSLPGVAESFLKRCREFLKGDIKG